MFRGEIKKETQSLDKTHRHTHAQLERIPLYWHCLLIAKIQLQRVNKCRIWDEKHDIPTCVCVCVNVNVMNFISKLQWIRWHTQIKWFFNVYSLLHTFASVLHFSVFFSLARIQYMKQESLLKHNKTCEVFFLQWHNFRLAWDAGTYVHIKSSARQ